MTCHANSAASLVVNLNIPSNATLRTVQCPSEFHQVLEQVQAFYNSCKNANPDDLLDAALCWTARTPEWPMESCPIPAPTSSPSVSPSSRGVTDNFIKAQYGAFQVLDPWTVGTELSPGLGVSLATWQGVMCLRAAFNEAFQDQESVQKFLKSVKRIVLEGLNIVWLKGSARMNDGAGM